MKPTLRLVRVASCIVAPFGLGAALLAHEVLRAIASLRWGAPSFATHEHTALAPAACVEMTLAFCLLGFAVRDAARSGTVCYRRDSLVPFGGFAFASTSVAIALAGCATLFGMEYAESGSAAFGFGWLGGSLLPGAIVLATATGAMLSALAALVTGRAAGLERLIALLASALSGRTFASRSRSSSLAIRFTPAAFARTCPSARHAGLRAPPIARS